MLEIRKFIFPSILIISKTALSFSLTRSERKTKLQRKTNEEKRIIAVYCWNCRSKYKEFI